MKKLIVGLVAGMLIGTAGMAAAATTQTVQATLAKFTISIDGQKQKLKSDPLVYKGTTYLPVREISEILGYDLAYDNTKKTIDLSKGENKVTETNDSFASTIAEPNPTSSEINMDEWISARNLVDDYGVDVEISSGKIRDLKFEINGLSISFSVPGSNIEGTYKSIDGQHEVMIKNGALYLSKSAAKFLRIDIQ
ncbi:hypothetical protein P40081_01150 [Paenibacillus sp. FSL P4-0081]|uniref:stalk domain-containing protein n=1 Tax=Paenibacillus sp. FSL P4-0081 TaxID=1536769 RepID=UPI0004F5B6CD|nr:stalk domain-containing protein [Paenibacillus sp. FSL P4-0081]AIQ26969.1 hypothetical protein P40081_01150 [Paenibacillus sp. FSL P4-0081]